MRRPVDTVMRWWRSGLGNSESPGTIPMNGGGGSNGNGNGNGISNGNRKGKRAVTAGEPKWFKQWDANGIPRSLVYPTTTLGRMLDQTADRFADTLAIVFQDRTWTYGQLRAEVNRMAGGLARLGVRKNDRVVMALPNCPEFVISFFAIQKLGAVVVNAGPLMGLDDLQHVITLTSPRLVIGLDLRAKALVAAGAGSTIEHWVWVTLQSYQGLLKRLGYQFKLWQDNSNGRDGDESGAAHVTLAKLLADAPAKPPTLEPSQNATAVLQPTSGTTGTLKLAQLTHRSLVCNALQVSTLTQCRAGQERVL